MAFWYNCLLNQQKANCQADSLVCWSSIRIGTRTGGEKKRWEFLVRGKKEALLIDLRTDNDTI